MSVLQQRHWRLPDTHNIRDLGGYARAGGGATQWRRLLRGDNLFHLEAESQASLVEAGLSLVIDLRNDREIQAEPNPFVRHEPVAYRNISLFERLSPIDLLASPFDMSERYRDALDHCGDGLAEVLVAIADAPPGLVLFHCTAGKDRTGLVAALLLTMAGVSEDDVIADYALTGTAEPLISRLRNKSLAAGAEPLQVERVLASAPATMATTLAHLNAAHGGLDRYLPSIGLTVADAGRLMERLCA